MRREQPERRGRTVAAIAVACVVAVAGLSRIHLLHAGQIDWDEGVYWLSMQSMRAGHPLFTAVYSSQPPAFLLFTEPPWALLGGTVAAAREVMLAWGLLAIAAGAVIAWRLAGAAAAVAVAVLVAIDPLMVRQSIVLQADGPATALAVIGIALAAIAGTSPRRRWTAAAAALAGAVIALGLLTKLFDTAALPPLVGLLVVPRGGRRLRAIAAGAGFLLAGAAVLVPLHSAWGAIWNQSVDFHLGTAGIHYGLSLSTVVTQEWYLEAAAAVGAALGWRRHPQLVLTGALWVAGSILTLTAVHPLFEHHIVALSPGLALLDGAGASAVFGWLSTRGRLETPAVAAGLVAVAILLIVGAVRLPVTPAASLGDSLVAALERDTPPDGGVVGDDQFYQAEAGRPVPPGLVDTSATRILSGNLTAAQVEAEITGADPSVCAVLFSTGRLSTIPGFVAWAAAHYPLRIDTGPNQWLDVNPACQRG